MQIKEGSKLTTFVRDMLSYGLAAFILLHQELTRQGNPVLVGAAMGLLGVPGILAGINLVRGSGRRERDGTTEQPSSSHPSHSSQS